MPGYALRSSRLDRTVSWSCTGASGLRLGDSFVSAPASPGGVQLWMCEPIGMYTKPSRRTGAAAVFARAVIDGTIASRSGSATVAPMPRRNVRRGKAFFEMIMMLSSSGTACC